MNHTRTRGRQSDINVEAGSRGIDYAGTDNTNKSNAIQTTEVIEDSGIGNTLNGNIIEVSGIEELSGIGVIVDEDVADFGDSAIIIDDQMARNPWVMTAPRSLQQRKRGNKRRDTEEQRSKIGQRAE